jgi:type IV secretion system protein VirD4
LELIPLFWRLARARRHYPWTTLLLAMVLAMAGYTIGLARPAVGFLFGPDHVATVTGLQHWCWTAGIVTAAGGLLWWVAYWLVLPSMTTFAWIDRRDDEADHAGGVATRLDIAQYASKAALRRRATVLRPSLAQVSWWRRRFRTPPTEYGVKLLTAGMVGVTSQVWGSTEDVTLRVGGTRTGKTGSMIPHIRTAPGPVVVTSTRTDLLLATRKAREAKGRVLVFNPTGIGDTGTGAGSVAGSTVRWSPLAGCADYATAQRRAEDLIPAGSPHSEGERWDVQARGLLAVLLHAAALKAQANDSGSVRLIASWLAEPDDATLTDIQEALSLSADPRVLKTEVRAILGINDRTLTSITATLRPAIRWASDAVAAEVGDAKLSDPDFFDVAGFVRGRTLHATSLAPPLDRPTANTDAGSTRSTWSAGKADAGRCSARSPRRSPTRPGWQQPSSPPAGSTHR